MDSLLPIKTSALCRIWADERVKLRLEENNVNEWNGHQVPTLTRNEAVSNSSGLKDGSKRPDNDVSNDHFIVLFAIVDAVNLHSSVGMHSLETFCTLRTVNWEGGHSVLNVTGMLTHQSFTLQITTYSP